MGKSSHFGSDKFPSNKQQIRTIRTKLLAPLLHPILFAKAAPHKAARRDDNDKRDTGEAAISELTGCNYHGLSGIPLIRRQSRWQISRALRVREA